jgi:hypothetical protein
MRIEFALGLGVGEFMGWFGTSFKFERGFIYIIFIYDEIKKAIENLRTK